MVISIFHIVYQNTLSGRMGGYPDDDLIKFKFKKIKMTFNGSSLMFYAQLPWSSDGSLI